MLATLDIFFPSVDYGKLLTSVIQTNMLLMYYYHKLGFENKAIYALKRSAETAKKFDALEDGERVEYTSPFLQGISITKQEIPRHDGKSKKEALVEFLKTIDKSEWIDLI